MKLFNLSVNQLNQNGYSKNMQTKGKIGALFAFPITHTPDDCLSCDGYSLLIVDYKDLYNLLGTYFNQANDPEGTFRIPDYNITRRFLQPSTEVGLIVEAGLPNITGMIDASNTNANAEAFGETYPDQITGAFGGIWGYQSALPDAQGGVMLRGFDFDASRCSAIYGRSLTVQPPSQTIHLCIKYK